MATFTLAVNGQSYTVEAGPDTPLLWVLRDTLGLTGTKFSCGIGEGGPCTGHIAGEAVRSCITPVSTADGKSIVTIEGLSPDGTHPLQQAWLAENGAQTGYSPPQADYTRAGV